MLRHAYEKILEREIAGHPVPPCVAVVLSSGDLEGGGITSIRLLIDWASSTGVRTLLLHIAQVVPGLYDELINALGGIHARISIPTDSGVTYLGDGDLNVVISLGYGGKREVTDAIKSLLKDVESGRLQAEDIDEKLLESRLRFDQKPELVIRAGGRQLSDFMIWQAAYSELYFTEVNWAALRKIDFLRAIRDYQRRERRFGK